MEAAIVEAAKGSGQDNALALLGLVREPMQQKNPRLASMIGVANAWVYGVFASLAQASVRKISALKSSALA